VTGIHRQLPTTRKHKYQFVLKPGTYDHSYLKTWDPVRSPLIKQASGRLVVGSVTTSEHRLLYVFISHFFLFFFLFGVTKLYSLDLLLKDIQHGALFHTVMGL
jgi:hypothetical protein